VVDWASSNDTEEIGTKWELWRQPIDLQARQEVALKKELPCQHLDS
jgi:hypothetical protein